MIEIQLRFVSDIYIVCRPNTAISVYAPLAGRAKRMIFKICAGEIIIHQLVCRRSTTIRISKQCVIQYNSVSCWHFSRSIYSYPVEMSINLGCMSRNMSVMCILKTFSNWFRFHLRGNTEYLAWQRFEFRFYTLRTSCSWFFSLSLLSKCCLPRTTFQLNIYLMKTLPSSDSVPDLKQIHRFFYHVPAFIRWTNIALDSLCISSLLLLLSTISSISNIS